MPTPVDTRANLHTADCYGQPLGARCRSCERRALVPLDVIGPKSGDMRELHTLPLKCRTCGRRHVELWLFVQWEIVAHPCAFSPSQPRLSDTHGAGKVLGGGEQLVDFHLERGLRLHTEPEHKNLYKWAINEIDAQGKKIGDDQIPWNWTLWFTATSCVLSDSIDIRYPFRLNPDSFTLAENVGARENTIKEEATPATPEIKQRQVIIVELRPGHPRHDGDYFRETTFSMFGTDRAIKSFQLDIYPLADPAERERCYAWGSRCPTRARSISGMRQAMIASYFTSS